MISKTLTAQTIANTDIFRRAGASPKPPFVMLHGIGSNASSFHTLIDQIGDDRNIIVWNAPGYGNSQHLDQEFPLAEDYANRLHQVLAELGLGRVILVGHSLGTLMATAFASLYPSDVQALILLASAQGYGSGPGSKLPQKLQERLDRLRELGPAKFAVSSAPGLIFEPENNPDLVSNAVNAMSQIDPAGYTQAVKMLSSGTLKETAGAVLCDSLVVVGDQDNITPPEQSHAVHEALSKASPERLHQLELIGNAGHAVHQQQPAAVAASILGFIKSIEADIPKETA